MYSINMLESHQLHIVRLTNWIEWHLCSMYLWLVSHFQPGPFSTAELYISSILVPYHPIHVSRCASQLNPGPISTQSRSRDLCLLSTPGSQIHVSSLSQLNPTSFWVLIFTSRLHPGTISPPSRSTKLHLSTIQASSQTHTSFKMCVSPPSRSFLNWRIVSQLHPSPISPYSRLKICISTQSRSHLNPIQVSRFVSPIHPGSQINVSSLSQLNLTSIWVLIFTSHLHPGNISPPSRSNKLHLSSIQASSQTHTGFKMCVSPPPRSIDSHLTSIQVVSHLHVGVDIRDSLILAGWNRKFITFCKGHNCSSII